MEEDRREWWREEEEGREGKGGRSGRGCCGGRWAYLERALQTIGSEQLDGMLSREIVATKTL